MALADYLGTVGGNIVLVLPLTVITALVCEKLNAAVIRYVEKRPWWPRARPLQKALCMNFGFPAEACTPPVLVEAFAFVVVFCGHHFLMGFMMLPVVCWGWSEAGTTFQLLLMMAALGDVALDLYDWIKKFLLTFFPNAFKSLGGPCPLPAFIVMCCLHHPLAMTLVIPMNARYAHLPAYHKIAASLLLAAGICFLTGQYKFTLDMRNRGNFVQYKVIVVLQLATIWFTRGIVWFTQLYAALTYFYNQGDKSFFIGGCIGGGLMSLFNLIMIMDCSTAAIKWLPRPLPQDDEQHDELQDDVVKRLSSTVAPMSSLIVKKKMRTLVKVAVAAQKFKASIHKGD